MHLTAQRVQVAATASQVPLVLGGDCTVGIGTVAGMLAAVSGRISLIHFDLNTVSPAHDVQGLTGSLAAALLYEAMTLQGLRLTSSPKRAAARL